MFIGRMLGWIMVLCGLGLLARYYAVLLAAGPSMNTDLFDLFGAENDRLPYVERSLTRSLSAMMVSGWSAALLIIFGVVLIYGCRRPKPR